MAGVGTSNQMALNPRDGRQTMASGINQRPRGCSSAARGNKLGGHVADEAEKKREGIKGGCWTTRRLCLDSSHYGEAVCGTLRRAGTVLGQQVLEQRRWYREQSAADTSRYLHVLLERAPYTRTNRGCLQGVCALASQWCRSTARDVPVAAKKEKELQVEKRTRLRDVEASTVASWTIKAAKWRFA